MMPARGGFAACAVAACALALLAARARADVAGLWATPEDKAHVRIAPCDARLCGEITWLKEPDDEHGKPKRDRRNEDESLRDRPIVGMELLRGFRRTSERRWEDGTIYNPEDGKTYRSKLELADLRTLKVSGCVLFFCKSQVWRRIE